jgi:hypothetical protein
MEAQHWFIEDFKKLKPTILSFKLFVQKLKLAIIWFLNISKTQNQMIIIKKSNTHPTLM